MNPTGGGRRLLVRDLEQLATPAGTAAPLRGSELAEVDVIEDAYVLCAGGSIESVGRMRDLPSLDGEVDEVDGRGLCAIPGLVDCHTHACFAGDRVEEFALRASGASYEELHAAGGGIMSTVRATRAAGPEELAAAVRTHRSWMLRAGRPRSSRSPATASTATPSSPRCRRSETRAGFPRGSGHTQCRPSTTTRMPTSTSS
jgi:Imidazolonepropionase and related amidohydrolases